MTGEYIAETLPDCASRQALARLSVHGTVGRMWNGRAARRLSVMAGALPGMPMPCPVRDRALLAGKAPGDLATVGALAARARSLGADADAWQLATAPPAVVDRLARADLRQAARR